MNPTALQTLKDDPIPKLSFEYYLTSVLNYILELLEQPKLFKQDVEDVGLWLPYCFLAEKNNPSRLWVCNRDYKPLGVSGKDVDFIPFEDVEKDYPFCVYQAPSEKDSIYIYKGYGPKTVSELKMYKRLFLMAVSDLFELEKQKCYVCGLETEEERKIAISGGERHNIMDIHCKHFAETSEGALRTKEDVANDYLYCYVFAPDLIGKEEDEKLIHAVLSRMSLEDFGDL
jgi:hypothetical protein